MWVAGIFFNREHGISPVAVNFGKLWAADSGAFLRLTGFRFGAFAAKPYGQFAPFLAGDLIADGPIDQNMNRITQWCGFITTQENEKGIIYQGRLEIDPLPLFMARKRAETDGNGAYKYGVVLRIQE